jgi:hypothetical protein
MPDVQPKRETRLLPPMRTQMPPRVRCHLRPRDALPVYMWSVPALPMPILRVHGPVLPDSLCFRPEGGPAQLRCSPSLSFGGWHSSRKPPNPEWVDSKRPPNLRVDPSSLAVPADVLQRLNHAQLTETTSLIRKRLTRI